MIRGKIIFVFSSAEPIQSEIHYQIPQLSLTLQQALSITTEKIIRLNPRFILGEYRLFEYNPAQQRIGLTTSFQNLLKLLVCLEELNDAALNAVSLHELNAALQKPQGVKGGLLRKNGIERWQLEDNSTKQHYRLQIDALLQKLGFFIPRPIEGKTSVDHVIVFGALAQRMEARIIQTVEHLKNNVEVKDHVFLLGSNRKLNPVELDYLKGKFQMLHESQATYWANVFTNPELATEANAFDFLWECAVPQDVQELLKGKLIAIKSTRIGASYQEQQGHRATTETTIEDWMSFYRAGQPQSIFAVAEQPYLRVADQLRFTVLTNGKKADEKELIKRIQHTTFQFASPQLGSKPLISVMLDEVARNVYRVVETLKYLESLNPEEPR